MSAPPADRTPRSRWLLRLASLLLSPLAFLAGLELLLWLAGFGGPQPLFVEVEERPGWLHANPDVMRRYFPSRAPLVSPEAVEFPRSKPSGTYRIVVQGGSTAAGFPYGRSASLAEMLAERLEATFPERDVEVISTAMAAASSYTLLDFVDEILDVEPDAVLIYAGHNEYMGILGVSSGLTGQRSRPATLLHLRLRRFRTYQYLEALVGWSRRAVTAAEPAGEPPRRNLMTRAAQGSRVPYGSEPWRTGVRQFEANLDAIVARYRKRQVPVFVATLASNEKDRPPFASADGPEDAAAWFERGQRALARGDVEDARRAFREARDRDELPFRAPEAFDGVIRELAARRAAVLVDVRERFVAESPEGIVGRELLLEHVHPNARGYFLLADVFFDRLRESVPSLAAAETPSDEEAMRDMPITSLDRAMARLALTELESSFPFVAEPQPVALPPPTNPVEELAWRRHHGEITWLEGMETLLQMHRRAGRMRRAAAVARMAARVMPHNQAAHYTSGALYLELGQPARARRYLERSLHLAPDDPQTRRALARLARLEAEAGRSGAR